MSGFSDEESYPIFPVYIVVDVSYSMAGAPIDAVNDELPHLKQMVEGDPLVGEIARIGIVKFDDEAQTVLPLSDLAAAVLPTLAPGGATNFGAAFREVKAALESDITTFGKGTRFYRPVVFFLSDGDHTSGEDWEIALKELISPSFKFSPEIVAYGYGDADRVALGKIATRYAFMAGEGDTASQTREVFKSLIGSIRTTSRSINTAVANGGGLVVEATDQFTPLPILTV